MKKSLKSLKSFEIISTKTSEIKGGTCCSNAGTWCGQAYTCDEQVGQQVYHYSKESGFDSNLAFGGGKNSNGELNTVFEGGDRLQFEEINYRVFFNNEEVQF